MCISGLSLQPNRRLTRPYAGHALPDSLLGRMTTRLSVKWPCKVNEYLCHILYYSLRGFGKFPSICTDMKYVLL